MIIGQVLGMTENIEESLIVKLMNLWGLTRRAYTCSEQVESLYESKPIP